jgi:hypothetical protein
MSSPGTATSTGSKLWFATHQSLEPSGRWALFSLTDDAGSPQGATAGSAPRSDSAQRSSEAALARSGSVPTQLSRPSPTGRLASAANPPK